MLYNQRSVLATAHLVVSFPNQQVFQDMALSAICGIAQRFGQEMIANLKIRHTMISMHFVHLLTLMQN